MDMANTVRSSWTSYPDCFAAKVECPELLFE